MSYLNNALLFLVQTVFGMYILAIMLRFMLQMVRADFYNPLSQFLVKITNPPLKPLRRIIPGLAGLDMASLLLALFLQVVLLLLIGLIVHAPAPAPLGLLLYAMVELGVMVLYIFIFSIIVLAILSWITPGAYNPVSSLLAQLSNPLMRPVRRRMPMTSGIDFSPMVALIILMLIKYLVADPLVDISSSLAYSSVGMR